MVDTSKRFTPDFSKATADNTYYALTMFPYPSGSGLHAGHASVFTINDVAARFQRMQGKTVFNPFGFDSFGLPTENYAMKQGKPAYEVTEENKAHFLKQVQALNLSFDYERVLTTSQADYYKWTQRIFAKLFDAGLVYRDVLRVNRCPDCQTVLANDQVVDGKCERCKNEIIQKKMPQWFIKITDYADRLIVDLDIIDRPEETKTAQKNWIGRSEGVEIDFEVSHSEGGTTDESHNTVKDSFPQSGRDKLLRSEGLANPKTITCFTTRPDTIYGVTAVVLAPENTDLDHLLSDEKKQQVLEYRQHTLAKTAVQRQQDAKDKTGVESGLFVIHPLTGENIPVWYADYVLADYGSGAVMMVPAHDERDFEFAMKYEIQVKQVIQPPPTPLGERGEQNDTAPRYFDFQENEQYIKENKLITNGRSLPYNPKMKERAKEMRKTPTHAEQRLWKEYLQGLDINVLRQKPLDHYIVDFYVPSRRLIIEVGGSVHRSQDAIAYDAIRDEVLQRYGLQILRISNQEVLTDINTVKKKIEEFIQLYSSSFDKEGARGGLPYTGKEGTLIHSGSFDGLDHTEAKAKIIEHLEVLGKGRKKITYKLRDRSVSRQRYWGSPIPIYYKPKENPKVPYYRFSKGIWAVHEDAPIQTRKTIAGVLRDPKNGKYAIIKRLNVEPHNYTLVLGGIDEGETGEQSTAREIQEETGYTNISYRGKIGEFQSEFWHAIKERNQHNVTEVHFFELNDHSNNGGNQEENENLEVVWMSPEEILTGEQDEHNVLRNHWIEHVEGKNPQWKGEWIEKYNSYNIAPVEECDPVRIPYEELPVKLPLDVKNYKPKGKSPLEEHLTFPIYEKDGKKYLRECDTLDTFMCSAFYFLRYPNVGDDDALITKELADKLFPIDLYTGGKEHTVGHLLYSRFIHKFLFDQGYLSSPEPFAKLVHQGMVLGADGRKMGKRYGNGVDPLEIVEEFGADAVRTYLMFMGPVEQDKIRNQNALNGVKKFLARVERLLPKTGMDMRVSDEYMMQSPDQQEQAQQTVESVYHQTIIDITGDLEKMKYNTAVSKIMILVNTIYEQGIATHEVLLGLTKFIALFATELGDRMRTALGQTDDVQFGNRPVADESKIVQSSITLPVQINGKVRANIDIKPGTNEEQVIELAKQEANVQKHLEDKQIRKVIFIQDKILNIVVS